MPKRKKTRKRKTRKHRTNNITNQTMKMVGDSTKAVIGLGVFSIAAKTVKDIAT